MTFVVPSPKPTGTSTSQKQSVKSEKFVEDHGLIDLKNEKVQKKIRAGSKVMAKGFQQSVVTAGDLNFDTLCQLVETGEVKGVTFIGVPTTVWQRCPPGKGALADTQGVITYDKPKIMMNLSNVKCCQQDYQNTFLPCLPYHHEDLGETEMKEAETLLEEDGRVHRAQLDRKNLESQLETTKRKREAVGELRKRSKLAIEDGFFTYILKGSGGSSYVGWTTCAERRLDQHLGYLEGGAEATKNRIWEKMCVAELPDKEKARRLEKTVKRFENRHARFNCMQRQCRDNGWTFKKY